MEFNFKGKRALVTGAGKGIGRSTAKALAKGGAEVIALTRTQADLDSLVAEVPSIKPLCVDLNNIEEAVKAIEGQGDIHLLVNSAAVMIPGPFLYVKQDDYDKIFGLNVKVPLFVAQAVGRKMVAGGYGGAIVNISSVGSTRAVNALGVNCLAKASVDMLTKVMALELGPHKIRVNCVNPTMVKTEAVKAYWNPDDPQSKAIVDAIPLGKIAEVEDVVHAILYLLSDKAAMVSGAILPIDGGQLAH